MVGKVIVLSLPNTEFATSLFLSGAKYRGC